MSSKGNRREGGRKRSLEHRIVLCADCDTNRTLTVDSSGTLICSSCGSKNWMLVAAPIVKNFREYNEQEVRERVAVDRYIAKLEREEFFVPHDLLV
jgi:hypothetical protein